MARARPEADRFFDPELGRPSPMRVELRRRFDGSGESWQMTSRLAYHDRRLGVIIVPEPGGEGITDLTSVPLWFSWLVPKTGRHLPAALVHDGLTPPAGGGYEIVPRREITQIDADRVFRDAMADLGTPPVRRWLVWSAVSVPTVRTTGWWRAALAYGSIALIVTLGVVATLDLVDLVDLLPWMGDRVWWEELALGLTFAVVVPSVLALVWPRRLRVAGLIVGVCIASLLHVTLAVAAVSLSYAAVEAVISRLSRRST
jgi:Protein of unknown function (DUF1353)